MNPSAAPLDTSIEIVTPENVAFDYFLAGPFHRFLAFLLDMLVVFLSLFGIAFVLTMMGLPLAGFGLLGVIYFLVVWGFAGVCEAIWNGQTPGKRAMQIRVVSTSGLPINAQQAILRNILRAADLSLYLLPGLMSALMTRRFQRLGDLAAQTMVVLEKRIEPSYPPAGGQGVRALAEQLPPSFQADARLNKALGMYVSRREGLTPPRRWELASILAAPLTRQWGLPNTLDPDLLLCAAHRRAFYGFKNESSQSSIRTTDESSVVDLFPS